MNYHVEPYGQGWAISVDGRIVIETIDRIDDAIEIAAKLNECVK